MLYANKDIGKETLSLQKQLSKSIRFLEMPLNNCLNYLRPLKARKEKITVVTLEIGMFPECPDVCPFTYHNQMECSERFPASQTQYLQSRHCLSFAHMILYFAWMRKIFLMREIFSSAEVSQKSDVLPKYSWANLLNMYRSGLSQ